MALDYFAPGVYVEEIDRGSRPIEGVSLSVAGFVGFTEDIRGDAELFQPMLITNWSQYLEYFGKPGSAHPGFTDFDAYLPFAVQGWFDNGGGRCWVVSMGTRPPGSEEPDPEEVATKILTSGKKSSLRFSLKPSDPEEAPALLAEGGRITVEIREGEPVPLPEDAPEDAESPFNTGEYFTVVVKSREQELETYEHLTMNPEADSEAARYAVAELEQSEYITLEDISEPGQPLSKRPMNGRYEVAPAPYVGSADRVSRDIQGVRDDRAGLEGLFEIDEVAMVACPDILFAYQKGWLELDQVHALMERLFILCENSAPGPAYRMAVIDAPPVKVGKNENRAIKPEQQKPQDVAKWLTEFNRRSMFGAVYYPWVKVANPNNGNRPIMVPPSGHMMGIWCRTDEARGVFKAPANETPRGVLGLAYETNMREQEMLNPKGINCIRNFASYSRGYKVWGARTLVEPDNVQWRYISVRRLISYIEKSIEIGTQWVVFEPNDQDLWARVTRTITVFLTRLWRDGALFGASPAEAFYVKCDGELNTHETMMLGRLYVEVGVCPVRPAEFVIFRLSQWAPNQ
ncbi:phage tail sheath C-terminal domain-containing protein [cf. Phormidesmis sp. LEGE 11477]|uniref:phage tail sheath family protein n=1 Tax=cf. Phormidesmis sp. LEGE 11477 TaxID=1828680 RepID=UPI0018805829|nr:phage tail sheath C-terminal domain-containing protein [cf. Phormidesmis sp. LEGE 11477]MBE9062414.1 phage tail sheath family protein [cf. Phormidesmis sp. LEGE 11477]